MPCVSCWMSRRSGHEGWREAHARLVEQQQLRSRISARQSASICARTDRVHALCSALFDARETLMTSHVGSDPGRAGVRAECMFSHGSGW